VLGKPFKPLISSALLSALRLVVQHDRWHLNLGWPPTASWRAHTSICEFPGKLDFLAKPTQRTFFPPNTGTFGKPPTFPLARICISLDGALRGLEIYRDLLHYPFSLGLHPPLTFYSGGNLTPGPWGVNSASCMPGRRLNEPPTGTPAANITRRLLNPRD